MAWMDPEASPLPPASASLSAKARAETAWGQGEAFPLPEAQLPPPQNGLMTLAPADVPMQFSVVSEVSSGHRAWNSRALQEAAVTTPDLSPPWGRGEAEGVSELRFPKPRPG